MTDNDEKQKLREIRYVYLGGFAAAILGGFVSLLVTQRLREALAADALVLLAGSLCLGLAGCVIGSLLGLSAKLLLEKFDPNATIADASRFPVVAAAVSAFAVGVLCTTVITDLLQQA